MFFVVFIGVSYGGAKFEFSFAFFDAVRKLVNDQIAVIHA